eukprot:CAMPEP_0204318754 /NCGR_PEP_ID=MMETSP0469-20131031/6713_1 /ASSEMBLY_ACC=CAM_ASM_000384 /TAXON_ID=2969 /ORGANISM="Oxyrrhis marina" /LENGTH=399 /DNA_ID=CAMNT_0051299847 /DNA_START=46 /DNA_END=1245 /DNA_ORIENTATION=-
MAGLSTTLLDPECAAPVRRRTGVAEKVVIAGMLVTGGFLVAGVHAGVITSDYVAAPVVFAEEQQQNSGESQSEPVATTEPATEAPATTPAAPTSETTTVSAEEQAKIKAEIADTHGRGLLPAVLMFLGRFAICLYFLQWGVIDNAKGFELKAKHAEERKFGNAKLDELAGRASSKQRATVMVVLPLLGMVFLLIGQTFLGSLCLLLFLAPSTYWQFRDRHGECAREVDDGRDTPAVCFHKNVSLCGALLVFLGFSIPVLGAILALVGRILWTTVFWSMGTNEHGGMSLAEAQLEKQSFLRKQLLGQPLSAVIIFILRMAAVEAGALGFVSAIAPMFGLSRFFTLAANFCGLAFLTVYMFNSLLEFKQIKVAEYKMEAWQRELKSLALYGAAVCMIAYQL